MNVIEIKNLTKYYGKTLGAKDLNLTIPEGSIYGFIGPNGAGKSTTLRMLMNMIFPTSGEASILGKDIVQDAFDIKHFVGYLPSTINLYKSLRVRDLIDHTINYYVHTNWSGSEITNNWNDCIYAMKKIERKEFMYENSKRIVELLQLDIDKKVNSLSFGNTKKLGIVLSMIHNPKVLILDEPTGGLDPLIQDKYFELLKEFNSLGGTIFFSSHILSEVEKVCDRVAIIKQGQIIRDEDVETLKQNNLKEISLHLSNIVKTQILNRIRDNSNYILKKQDCEAHKLSFSYKGEINELLTFLTDYQILNITINEPSLEDIFKHYYE